MDLTKASAHIHDALKHLELSMGETVFDEWVLAKKVPSGWQLVEYQGPRSDGFQENFKRDMASLREVLDLSNIQAGEFAFSHDGYGSGFDAYMCAGEGILVLFNHTTKSTGEFTGDPRWKAAQIHFSNLLETFVADPVR